MPTTTPARDVLTRAAGHAFAWLDGLDARSVATTATLEEMRARLGRPLADRGVAATQVIDDLVADVEGGILGSQSGRFFGWVIGGGLPAAMAADWLTTRPGIRTPASTPTAPPPSVVEEIAGGLAEGPVRPGRRNQRRLRHGHADGACHLHGRRAPARGAARPRLGRGAARAWLGAPRDPHPGQRRSARLGRPRRAVHGAWLGQHHAARHGRRWPCVDAGRPAGGPGRVVGAPTIVVLQAGELAERPSIPSRRLAPMARAASALDSCGRRLRPSGRGPAPAYRRSRRAGSSSATAGPPTRHEYLNVPYDSGLAFVRDAQAHRAAMTLATSYLPAGGAARDQIDWNPEFSRRARGLRDLRGDP